MNEYKKRADKELKEIADADREFLEETLYPIVDKNKKERPRHKRWQYIAIVAPMCLLVIMSVGIGLGIRHLNAHKEVFEDYLKSDHSDMATLNGALEKTQLAGEFGYVVVNCWAKKGTPVLFTASNEIYKTDDTYISLTVDVIVDPEYGYEFLNIDKTRTEHLGYTVEYNLRSGTYADDEPTVYEYDFRAYMDTGKERYIIRYSKMSIYEGFDFQALLNETIIEKQ